MATYLRSVLILWLALALYVVSICEGDVGDIVTQDFFNALLSAADDVGDIVTQDFFNAILSAADDSCAGQNFYTYNDFINAANAFSGFGTTGTADDNKRELAAFFANAAHVTASLCYVEQISKSDYCDSTNTQYPCATGKQYYGRGPIQLSWNYNYGKVGNYLGFDGLNNPDIVAQDDSISWKAAVWFWMLDSNCHSTITSGQGFGATIQAMHSGDCNSSGAVSRVKYYINYCSQFGVDPGSDLSC